jgi:S-(hydroxymethyl)mycothiol dehydrogenase
VSDRLRSNHRSWRGAEYCGDALPSNDFPLLAQLYLQGKLKLDEMITARIGLGDVSEAFHAMETGDVLRSVIIF